MKIQIKGFAGIDYAEFDVAPLALLVGHNHQGKSSIAQAIAAALANTPAVRHVRLKKDLQSLVNDAREKEGAFINIQADDGASACKLTWPEGDYTSIGPAFPRSTALAVGLVSPLTIKPEERAAFLIEALQAQATLEDVEMAFRTIVTEEARRRVFIANKLWPQIQEKGWDSAYKHADELRLQQEQKWWGATNERYGHRKAETWRPDPWWQDLESPDVTILTLTAERDRLKAAVDAATDTAARTTADKIALLKRADTLPESQRGLGVARTAEQHARAALQTATESRRACLEVPQDQPSWHNCPHCREPIVVRDGKLFAPSNAALMPEQIRERQAAIAAADKTLRSADLQLQQAQRTVIEWEQAVENAERAAESLNEAAEAEGQPGAGSVDHIAEQRQHLMVAEQRLHQFTRFETASRLHRDAQLAAKIADQLAPDGIRMRVLTAKLEQFNKQLAALCQQIGHPPLWIAADMGVHVAQRDYAALSDSEKFVAQVAFRCAVSMLDVARGFPVACVVVDGADILDPPTRGKLIKMLLASKLPSVVTMTVGKPGDVPDLSRGTGTGATYWVQAGKVRPIAEMAQQVAA